MTNKSMSQNDYVQRKGDCCPFCGSTDVSGGSVHIDEGRASQEVGCNICDAEWNDTYRLTGYVEL